MKIYPIVSFTFGLLLILTACNKDNLKVTELCPDCDFTCLDDQDTDFINSDCTDQTTCEFKVHPNSTLDIGDRKVMSVKDGDKTVLRFSVYNDPSTDISDDELTTILGMELPKDQTSFSLDDDQLKNINLHSQQVCFCSDIPTNKVEKGCIQGEKQTDGTWIVQGNLTIVRWQDQEVEVKFEVQFSE